MPSTMKAGRWAAGYRVLLIGLCLYAILAYSGALKRRFNGEIFSYYFFIDIDALGLGPVLRNALLLALGFLVIGYVLYGADRLLGRRRRPRSKPRDGVASHG